MTSLAKTAVLAAGIAAVSMMPNTAKADSWYVNFSPYGYSFGYYDYDYPKKWKRSYRRPHWHYHGPRYARYWAPPRYHYTGWYW